MNGGVGGEGSWRRIPLLRVLVRVTCEISNLNVEDKDIRLLDPRSVSCSLGFEKEIRAQIPLHRRASVARIGD